jgi:cysteine-rich repeat protein
VEPGCGNGLTEAPEETCDDSNMVSGDGCSAACRLETQALSSVGFFICALSSGGTVKCWGDNSYGQLGLGDTEARGDEPNEMGENLPTVALGSGRYATSIATGMNHVCALLDDGSIKCWGDNLNGTLGLGDTENRGDEPDEMGDNLPAVSLGTGLRAVGIAAGLGVTCALLNDRSLKCWGHNRYGQLGLGDTEDRGDEPGEMGNNLPAVNLNADLRPIALATTGGGTCALLDDSSVRCWGMNSGGALGTGDDDPYNYRGDEPGEMGDALPAISLGTGRRAVSVEPQCALLDDGSVKCWGSNWLGSLGLGDMEDRGDEPGEMGDDLPAVNLGSGRRVTTIDRGGGFACALLDDRSMKCWGYGMFGQLGLGDTENRGDEAGEMGDDLPAVALGSERYATAVSSRGGFGGACALLDDGTVKCWGSNASGQLGLGDTEDRGDEPDEMGDNLPVVELGF